MQSLENHQWFLYSDRPFDAAALADTTTLRCGNITGALVATAFSQWHFPRWALADRCDLFWSPRHQLPLRLPRRLPTVVSLHDLVFKSQPKTMRFAGRLLERTLTPPSLKRANAILVSSQSTKDELGVFFPEQLAKTEVVLLSSSLHRQTPADPSMLPQPLPTTPYFAFSGSLEPRKNIDRLLAAFEELKTTGQIPHHLVLISGGGWHNEATLRAIERLGPNVRLYNNVSEAEKALIFGGADFITLPSLHEGYGIPLAEGIKLGKPVLTSNTASMPEVARDAGAYADPTNVDSIREALLRLCTDRLYRDQLANNAQKLAQTYGWQHCAERTLAVFKATVGETALLGDERSYR